MKDARYVIRLSHSGAYTPSDQAELLTEVRRRISPLGGQAINLRVSRRAIEFDLFCPPDKELHPYLTALEPLGPVLTYKRLDSSTPVAVPAQVIAEARQLFNEERYWEAHEVLEGLWKPAKGAEKQLLQGIILTAAALVHAQKNETAVMESMLQTALERLDNQPPTFYGLDVRRFTRELKKISATKSFYFPTI